MVLNLELKGANQYQTSTSFPQKCQSRIKIIMRRYIWELTMKIKTREYVKNVHYKEKTLSKVTELIMD